jgi:hypothetical protein
MFIEKIDFDASVRSEILDALTKSDESVLALLVERAIAEMEGYLSSRYDTVAIFAARGEERLQIVVMMCVDIAVYHAYCLGNPIKLSEMRKTATSEQSHGLKLCKRVRSISLTHRSLRTGRCAQAFILRATISVATTFNHPLNGI